MIFKRSFSGRLSFRVISVTAALFIVSSLITFLFSIQYARKNALDNAKMSLDALSHDVESVLKEVEAATHTMIWVVKKHKHETEYMYHFTYQLLQCNDLIVGSSVAYEPGYFPEKGEFFAPYSYKDPYSGQIVSMQLGNEKYNYFQMEWYSKSKDTKTNHWSDPYYDDGGGDQLMTTYSIPLWDDDGKVYAIMTADVSLTNLVSKIAQTQPFPNSYCFILTPTDKFIAKKGVASHLQSLRDDSSSIRDSKKILEISSRMKARETGSDDFVTSDGGHHFVVYGPVSNGWSVAVVSPYNDVFRGLNRATLFTWLIVQLVLFVMFFVTKTIVKHETDPIIQFSYTALNIAKGNFAAVVPHVKTEDELSLLRNSLDYMLKSINTYLYELRTSTAANERYESELSIARKIQMDMLSSDFPKDRRVDLFANVIPAKEVGGDLYDFVMVGDYLYFAVGDVSGKGVPAALYMAISRSAFRFMASTSQQIDTAACNINNVLCSGNVSSMFVTLFIARINLQTGLMEYCNMGHNPIAVIQPDGTATYLHALPNLTAGIMENFQYRMETLQVDKGSRLILYTDGITEAEQVSKNQFGEDRLIDFCSSLSVDTPSSEVVASLIAQVRKFTAGNEQNDDITVMSVKLS